MLSGKRTFIGFGFGAIQSGLFLYEAFNSGEFNRLVVAEVNPEIVKTIRQANACFFVNIAHKDHIEITQIGPIEIYDPSDKVDCNHLIEAVAEASEIATAVPSIEFYASNKPGSIHSILANGLCEKINNGGPSAVIYTAKNNNHAAEILKSCVFESIPENLHQRVQEKAQFLNTVIGKMSQVVNCQDEIYYRQLKTITQDCSSAFLVETFNRILISKIDLRYPFERGISVFEEKKEDLFPFEEAKLYGHNAIHALMGYIGSFMGIPLIKDLADVPGIIPFARAAFIEESGKALIKKYQGIDVLFTASGYKEYADDLIERMVNPFLADTIERVTRDTYRKLAWNDRLIGTMRIALSHGIQPFRFAFDTAAAIIQTGSSFLKDENAAKGLLDPIWKDASPEKNMKEMVIDLIVHARDQLIN